MDLTAAVDQLYGAAPEEFVAARKQLAAQARRQGDRMLATRVLALRKPTLPAWAINATVRSQAPELGEFVQLASSMREAQSALDGPAMRRLSREREPLLASMAEAVAAAAQEGGQRLTPPVLAEVRGTLIAAIADPAAQEAVLSGCLTRALAYAGLGEVDLTQATAAPARARADEPSQQSDSGDEPAPAQAVPEQEATPEASAPDAPAQEATLDDTAAPQDGLPQNADDGAGERFAPESRAQVEVGREAEQRAAARRRLLDRARDRLTEAEREVTARSLVQAQAHEQALRATTRAAELERLLRRATQEAEEARRAQEAADQALADAGVLRDDARAELAALQE